MNSATHQSYLEQLGIPLTSRGTPQQRRKRAWRGSRAIGIFNESDLNGGRGQIFWRFHDDEARDGRTVLIKRGFSTVARIECPTDSLAWDAERICAGIRFKRGAE